MSATKHRPRAFITGGAKRIGAAIAAHLAPHYDLILHYRHSKTEAEQLAQSLKQQHGCEIVLVQADFSQPGSVAQCWQNLPSCDVLVLNASSYTRGTIEDMDFDQLRMHLSTNLGAPLLMIHRFLAQLPEEATGKIIVMGDRSMTPEIAPKFFAYAASKLAWNGFFDVLAESVAQRARIVMLGLLPTLPNTGEESMFERLTRVGTVEEILSTIDRVLTDANNLHGQVIPMQGIAQ